MSDHPLWRWPQCFRPAGLINILPIPPFDGGNLSSVIKRAFGVKGVTTYEIATNLIGFVLLFVFLGWITWFDILRMGG
jgi:membrane-associated protease RseP (regulator of RpoE activity)